MTPPTEKYISQLLYDYDCVIVPQLGGFMTNYKPALFKEGIAYPPSKELRFNKNLTKNDGLLSQSISQAEGISIKEADAVLHEAVQHYLSTLREGKRVKLTKVGVLYIDENDSLRFQPDGSVNYLRGAFGFEPFSMPNDLGIPLSIEKELPKKEIRDTSETKVIPIPAEPAPAYSKGIYWVAAATLLPFIGLSLYMGFSTGFKSPTDMSVAELFPGSVFPSQEYSQREAKVEEISSSAATNYPENTALFPFDFESNEVDSLGVWINMSALSEKAEKPKSVSGNQSYHIIGGCFGEKENAEKFVNRLQMRGYGGGVLDLHKGLYRVKIDSYGNYDKALRELTSMREDGTFPNAWLLKKKTS